MMYVQLFVVSLLSAAFEVASAEANYTYNSDGWFETPGSEIYFDVYNLTNYQEGKVKEVSWFTTLEGAHHASYRTSNDYVSKVINFEDDFQSDFNASITGRGSFNVSMNFLGYSNVTLTIYDENNQTLEEKELMGTVLIGYPVINTIFLYMLGIMIFLVYINMGATLDMEVVKTIIKKPVGPIVGLCCQYTIMPLVAFGLARLFFSDNPLLQLGLFLNGASPGGGPSNIWTYLLGGSLDLSVTMTFTSTVVALVAVPTWVLSLGPVIFAGTSFVIPYGRIAMLIVLLVIPCGVGIVMQFVRPKWSKFLADHVLKKVAVTNMLFIVTFGVYANRYVFRIFTPTIVLACCLLPILGYLSGLVISKLAGRTTPEIISISIETGVQNANIAIFILKSSIPQPAGDLTVVIPVAVAMLTPIPLFLILIIKKVYERFVKSSKHEISTPENEIKEGKENPAFDAVTENGIGKYEVNDNAQISNGVTSSQNL